MNGWQKYFDEFQSARAGDHAWLRGYRHDGWEAFAASGIPGADQEDWKYTSLAELNDRSFSLPLVSDAPLRADVLSAFAKEKILIVFVDGHFHPLYSRGEGVLGLEISHWKNLSLPEDALPANVRAATQIYHDPFCSLNQAFTSDCPLIAINKEFASDDVIHVVHVSSGQKNTLVSPRLVCTLADGVTAALNETFIVKNSQDIFINGVTDVIVGRDAVLEHATSGNYQGNIAHVQATRVLQDQASSYSAFSMLGGGKVIRHNLSVRQAGEAAKTTLNGLFIADGTSHIDHHTVIDHACARGSSRQLYKGIMAGKGRGVFNGRIHVRPGAHEVDSAQLNKNLLLSREARIDTKPELFIDVSDVKCKHGATVGQLSDEEIFYLESRAIPRSLAQRILMQGFAEDALSLVKNGFIQRYLSQQLGAYPLVGRLA